MVEAARSGTCRRAEAILRLEFPDEVVHEFLAGRELSDRLAYGVALYVIRN